MERCEICNRHPAKRLSFKAHQGFLVFRREIEYSGVYCRDHALMAYAKARGQTLAGMWFSPGALVFGTLRSLLDSAKLLELPPEVKDEPWVPHQVGCPWCGKSILALAGPVECESCHKKSAIVSCPKCGTAHSTKDAAPDAAMITCRACGNLSKAPNPARNWPSLLVARALGEVVAVIACADGGVNDMERQVYQKAITQLFKFSTSTIPYLNTYFNDCLTGRSSNLLPSCITNCQPEFCGTVIRLAILAAKVDGDITTTSFQRFVVFASSVGLTPIKFSMTGNLPRSAILGG